MKKSKRPKPQPKHCGICNDKGYRWGDKTKLCVCQLIKNPNPFDKPQPKPKSECDPVWDLDTRLEPRSKPKPEEVSKCKRYDFLKEQNSKHREIFETIVRQYGWIKAMRGEETLQRWLNEWADMAKEALK
jgi:hypothetical protein